MQLRDDLLRSHRWRELPDLSDMLAWTIGKTAVRTADDADPDGARFGRGQMHVAFFADGDAFAIVTTDGWGGSEVTAGEAERVAYYALTPATPA